MSDIFLIRAVVLNSLWPKNREMITSSEIGITENLKIVNDLW